MDTDRCCRLILKNNLHENFIEAMKLHDFDQENPKEIQNYLKIRENKHKSFERNLEFPESKDTLLYFKHENRHKMIISMISEAIEFNLYDIAVDIS